MRGYVIGNILVKKAKNHEINVEHITVADPSVSVAEVTMGPPDVIVDLVDPFVISAPPG